MVETRSDAASETSICRGPGCSASKLCNAHIIPSGFFRDVQADGDHVTMLLPDRVKRAPPGQGDYDRNILCADCDRFLGKLDEYAQQICRDYPTSFRVGDMATMADIDTDKFARFVLSVLWRASVSSRPHWQKVALGPYEARARDVVFGLTPRSDLTEYQLVLYRYWAAEFQTHKFYSTPTRDSFDGFNAWGMGLGGFRMVAKLDQRPLPALLAPIVVGNNSTLSAFVVSFEGGPDHGAMLDAARANAASIRPRS